MVKCEAVYGPALETSQGWSTIRCDLVAGHVGSHEDRHSDRPATIAWAGKPLKRPSIAILASEDEWTMIRFGLHQRAESFRASSPHLADEYELLAARLFAALVAGGQRPSERTSDVTESEARVLDGNR